MEVEAEVAEVAGRSMNTKHTMKKTTKNKFIFAILFTFFLLSIPCVTSAQDASSERILDYKSEITINKDSTMDVIERITVRCEGINIIHGIYRDFPTRYKDKYGVSRKVRFDVFWVRRDNKTEPYEVSGLTNGRRVKIGDENVFLQPGNVYTYTIKYRTDRQLGYFPDHDELYWNVTGNGWDFTIDKVKATVILPSRAIIPDYKIKLKGYTGPQGEDGTDYKSSIDPWTEDVVFESTRPLNSFEGMSIVVGFPKGYVHEPTKKEKIRYFIEDNFASIIGLIGLLILLVYYLSAWFSEGKDIPKGTIIPLFEPPEDLSPGAVRYIKRMGYDNKVFAATVINLAVKGYLTIEDVKKTYVLKKKMDLGSLEQGDFSLEEKFIARKLDAEGGYLELENTNHEAISDMIKELYKRLKSYYEGKYFVSNIPYVIFGVVLSVLAFVCMILGMLYYNQGDDLFSFLFGAVFGVVGISIFLFLGLPHWRIAIAGGKGAFQAVGTALFATFFLVMFGGFGMLVFFFQGSSLLGMVIALYAGINILFYHLMKAPTQSGRKILDQIDGFRMYLSCAEKDRLNILNPPEKTPELFEKYLPYALALGVEQRWSEEFAEVLEKAQLDGSYNPVWYSGAGFHSMSTSHFTSSLGSGMTSMISSSSMAPGSSSGFGGGGGSGGGGGGGGGGGW